MNRRFVYPKKKARLPLAGIVRDFQRSQQSMQSFVQAIPVPLSINTFDGRFLAANRKFTDLVGYRAEDLVGSTPEQLHLWANEVNTHDLVFLLREQNWVKNREIDLQTKDGRVINTLLSAERFGYHGQESMLVSLVDITEKKRLESRMRSRSDLLVSTNEMSRTLAEVMELPQIYDRLDATVRQLMPEITSVSISLYDPQSQRLNRVYGLPLDMPDPNLLLAMPHMVMVEARRNGNTGKLHFTGRLGSTGKLGSTGRLGRAGRLGSTGSLSLPPDEMQQPGLAVSMVAKGEVIGIIQVQARPRHVFTEAENALLSWIANTAAASIQSTQLFDQLHRTNLSLDQAFEATLESLARALELREQEHRGHTDRVILTTVELARKMGITGKDLENIRFGARIHDIGKVGIPDHILLKPGPLTEQEWLIMRKHPVYAYEMLAPIPQFQEILDIPYCHHEKWDGSGYPRRLKGEEIPLSARIFAVVDVWDALSSNRPYRAAWPRTQVLEFIRYQAGKHFDPTIANQFLELIG